jgi:AcrR family transcriptional regulator
MRSDAVQTRHNILGAAVQVVLEQGVTRLTLEAVAAQAGVSKGGLLYHFPSKESLIQGMVEEMVSHYEDLAHRYLSETHSEPGSWSRATIQANREQDVSSLRLSTALLTAAANNPELLEPMRQRYQNWQALSENDGLDPATATLVRLALDGLWLSDLLDLAPPQGELRQTLFERLNELTKTSV